MESNYSSFTNNNLDYKELINSYLKHWKWFVFSLAVFLFLAFVYIRYATPEYAVQAKIKIIDDKGSGTGIELFKDLNVLSGAKNNILDEIEQINSRTNLIEVVKELGLNTQIEIIGQIKDQELYKNAPININFIEADSIISNAKFEFFVTLSSATGFGYQEGADGTLKNYTYGSNIHSPLGDIVITPNLERFNNFKDGELKVSINPVETIATYYSNKLNIGYLDDFSNIVEFYLEDPVPQKAKDIINTLIYLYNNNAIEDKRIIANRTSDFINDRITDISSSLTTVDQTAEDFKAGKGITDIASEANINLNTGAANQQELLNTTTQLNIAGSMKDIVDNQQGYDVLPSNVGLSDPSIVNMTVRYNELVLERKRLLKSSNEKNPIIVNLDQQLAGLKRGIQSSLNSMTNNLNLQVNSLSSQRSLLNSRIYSAPKNERALRDITRQQQTTESLYLYLLEKREESQIAFATTSPKSKIIDNAYLASIFPVAPKTKALYLAAFLLGLIFPFSIIYLKDLMNTKIHNMNDLEKLAEDSPVLGELPKLAKKESKMIVKDDRSVLAESLRIIRTNLDYLIKAKLSSNDKNNIIYVSSSVPGEGKTFLTINLSMVLASNNKKVLLLEADIRNPRLYSYFTGSEIDRMNRTRKNKDAGLTEYLYNDELESYDIINSMLVYQNTIDVIYSGRIPPNPTDLLMSKRLKSLLKEASQNYDYVIVDTAPLMLVSDTLLISEYANHLIYVTRAEVTEKSSIKFPLKLQKDKKIKGLSFVVNDVMESNLGYNGKYGYGYGYGKSNKKGWKIWPS